MRRNRKQHWWLEGEKKVTNSDCYSAHSYGIDGGVASQPVYRILMHWLVGPSQQVLRRELLKRQGAHFSWIYYVVFGIAGEFAGKNIEYIHNVL